MLVIKNRVSVMVDAEITIKTDPVPIENLRWSNEQRTVMEMVCEMNGMNLGSFAVGISIASDDLNTQDLDADGGSFTYRGKQIRIEPRYFFGVMPEILAKRAKEKFTMIRFPFMKSVDLETELIELLIVTNGENLKGLNPIKE